MCGVNGYFTPSAGADRCRWGAITPAATCRGWSLVGGAAAAAVKFMKRKVKFVKGVFAGKERKKMMEATYKRPSPCVCCARVDDPEDCENKRCAVWRQWFLAQWGQTTRILREQAEKCAAYDAQGCCDPGTEGKDVCV